MAEFNPTTVTLGKLAEIYSEEQNLRNPISLGTILGPYKDMSALEFFDESNTEISEARAALKKAQQGEVSQNAVKTALKNLRYLSNRLYNAYDRNPPEFLISNEKNTPKVAQEFFGVKEPPKAVSSLQVNPDPEVRKEFIQELMDYAAANPDKKPHVRAILFGLNTGFRPNANIGVTTGQYIPGKGALYIRPDVVGAKGNPISVPLNDIADSMLQQQLREYKDAIESTGKIFVDNNGKPLKTSDINAVLEQIKVPELVYDAKSGEYYDSFKPAGADGSKFGMSLFRNYHTTVSRKLGMNDLVLAKLQGRSTKSYGKGSTGELSTYDSAFPGDVSDYEREQANILTGAYGPDIDDAKRNIKSITDPDFDFDWGGDTDTVKSRVTEATEGYGSDYFKREVADQAPTTKAGSRAAEKAAQVSDDDIVNKILKGFGKTLSVLPVVGLGASALFKSEEVKSDPTKSPAEGAVEFVAEEFTPLGVTKPVVEAAAEPVAEEYAEQTEEAGLAGDEESQVFRLFGESPFK